MITDCINENLNAVMDVLASPGNLINTAMFVNPQATIITNLLNAGVGRQTIILSLLGNPLSGVDGTNANAIATLYNTITLFSGGSTVIVPVIGAPPPYSTVLTPYSSFTALGQYQAMTDFMSGKVQKFPETSFDPGLGIANLASIGAISFSGLIGIAAGSKVSESTLCQADPNDPCRKINAVFGAILGVFNAALNAIIAGFGLMSDFLTQASVYLTQVLAFIDSVLNIIKSALGSVVDALFTAIRMGLAKLLTTLDPCMRAVIGNIAGPDLAAAIGL